MERPGESVSLEEARRRLVGVLSPLSPVVQSVDDAVGRVLAEEIVADVDVPPFADSAMDGYAVRACDTTAAPVRLKIAGEIRAGSPTSATLGAGEAMAVATGGVIPDGADAVCMIERVTRDGDEVIIEDHIAVGNLIRPAGDDIARHSVVFAQGTRLTSAHVGVLASLGCTKVVVYPSVRVGVLATGDEVIDPPDTLTRGRIYDANRHALIAACRMAGHKAVDLGIVGDDPLLLEKSIVAAAEGCDVIVTSGGVSVGVADHAKTVLERLGPGSVQWMEMRIKPGKPFGFAVLADSGTPVLCLPGNPVSALVVFELMGRSALEAMSGDPTWKRPMIAATAAEPFPPPDDGKVHFRRAVVSLDARGSVVARVAGPQGSHQLHALARANALAVVDASSGAAVGGPVRVMLLDTPGWGMEDST